MKHRTYLAGADMGVVQGNAGVSSPGCEHPACPGHQPCVLQREPTASLNLAGQVHGGGYPATERLGLRGPCLSGLPFEAEEHSHIPAGQKCKLPMRLLGIPRAKCQRNR